MPKKRAPLRKSFRLSPSPPHQIKSYYVFGTKIFLIRYTEIYRNMQAFAFKVLQECISLVSRNGAMQMFSLTPNKNMFPEKFVK